MTGDARPVLRSPAPASTVCATTVLSSQDFVHRSASPEAQSGNSLNALPSPE